MRTTTRPAVPAAPLADRSLSPAGRGAASWGASAPLRPQYAPLVPLRGRARGSTPSTRITSPCGSCHAGPAAHAHGRAGRPGLATVQPLARPLCVRGRGGRPRMNLSDVGVGPRLERAQVPRLPDRSRPAWGGSVERDCAARAACPAATRRSPTDTFGVSLAGPRPRGRHIKRTAIGQRGGEGSIPRDHKQEKHQAGVTDAAPGGTTGGATGVGVVRPESLCCAAAYSRDRSA